MCGAGVRSGIGRCFAQHVEERGFEAVHGGERRLRSARHADPHVGRDAAVVLQQAQLLQIVEGLAHAPGIEARCQRQLVGGQAAVRLGLDDGFEQRHELPLPFRREVGTREPAARLLDLAKAQAGGEDLAAVFVPLQQIGVLEPRDRGLHARVLVAALQIEVDREPFGGEELADGDDDIALGIGLAPPQRLQDLLDVTARETALRAHAELPFGVALVVEQHAAGTGLIAPGAAGFLDVVLERPRHVGVDHEAHVGLVDAHAEGIGGDDHLERAVEEGLLAILLEIGRHAAVKRRGRPAHRLRQEFRQNLGVPLRGAVDDGAAGGRFLRARLAEVIDQHLVHLRELGFFARRHDREVQVLPFGSAEMAFELDAEPLPEMHADVLDHVLLGGGREAGHRRQVGAVPLANKARDVQVIGAEVVAPFRQAVRLVEHPRSNLPMRDRLAEAAVTHLLRRHQQDADIAEPDAVENLFALGQRQEAIHRRGRGHAAPRERVDLILHERLQGRDDDRERAGLAIAHQRRQLIAERLAAASGQDPEERSASERVVDDLFLERVAAGVAAKVVVAEPALEPAPGVVGFAAISAPRVGAGCRTQLARETCGGGVLEAHPGRDHRVFPGHAQPGKHVGDGGAQRGIGDLVQQSCQADATDLAGQCPREQLAHLGRRRARLAREREEEVIEAGRGPLRHQQMVIGAHHLEGLFQERASLVVEERDCALRIGQRIAHRELEQLVVLDQMVVGVARKGERREGERIHHRQAEEPETGCCGPEDIQVMADDVVAEEERCAGGERIDVGERCRQIEAALEVPEFTGIGAQGPDLQDPSVLRIDLQIEAEAAGGERRRR